MLGLPTLLGALVLEISTMSIALSVRVWVQALVARWLGDDTAWRAGRPSFLPFRHLNFLGGVLIPSACTIASGGFGYLGWTRPLPIAAERFRASVPRRAGLLLAMASGLASNLALALLALIAALLCERAGAKMWTPDGSFTTLGACLSAMFQVNVALTLLNVLPLPPLDGSRLLPASLDAVKERARPFSFALLIFLATVRPLDDAFVVRPVRFVLRGLQAVFDVQLVSGMR